MRPTTWPTIVFALCLPLAAQAQLLVPRYAHSATLLADGRVLIHGGLGPGDAFMPGTELGPPGALASGPRNHRARAFHTATALPDGTVLIAGGFILPYSTSRTAELLDDGRFVFLESRMSVPRELHSATLLEDGRVLIAGGFVGGVTSVASCDLYDPATRSFVPTEEMAQSRYGHAACRLADGRVLITGGTQFPDERTISAAEVFDPVSGSFASVTDMLVDRSRHTATLLPDGRVLIAGGNCIAAGRQLAGSEIFDPATGSFTTGPEMAEPRMDHTATALPDGRVLITGGFNAEGGPHTLDSCEVFDPASGQFAPAGRLPRPVHEHRATLLPSGEVLITGGMIVEGQRRTVVTETAVIRP